MMKSIQPAPDNRVYRGARASNVGAAQVARHDPGKPGQLLCPRLDLRRHSPDGFQWGYSGSGPAQLALALCADATGDDALAMKVYQRFKEQILAPLIADEWVMAALSIREFCHSLAGPGAAVSDDELIRAGRNPGKLEEN